MSYIVNNPTESTVILPDLKVEIGKNKIIDLEQMIDRESIEKSCHLKQAIKLKKLRLVRFTSVKLEAPVQPPPVQIVEKTVTVEKERALDEDKIVSLVKKIVDEQKSDIDTKLGNLVPDISNILSKFQDKIESISPTKRNDDFVDTGIKVDQEKLAAAQQQSLDKMTNQIETNDSKHKKIKIINKKNLNDLADEI